MAWFSPWGKEKKKSPPKLSIDRILWTILQTLGSFRIRLQTVSTPQDWIGIRHKNPAPGLYFVWASAVSLNTKSPVPKDFLSNSEAYFYPVQALTEGYRITRKKLSSVCVTNCGSLLCVDSTGAALIFPWMCTVVCAFTYVSELWLCGFPLCWRTGTVCSLVDHLWEVKASFMHVFVQTRLYNC